MGVYCTLIVVDDFQEGIPRAHRISNRETYELMKLFYENAVVYLIYTNMCKHTHLLCGYIQANTKGDAVVVGDDENMKDSEDGKEKN